MSNSNSSSELEMSESTESALIESMEVQIDAMHDEIQKLHGNNYQTKQEDKNISKHC